MVFFIRPPRAGDGAGINTLRRMPGTFETILGIPSEREKRSEAFVADMPEHVHAFVAVAKQPDSSELLIGFATLAVATNPRLRHSGSIALMVHAGYQGQGVGTALMEALLDIADNWLMLVRVELTVFADNVRAIGLYQKLGFEAEGTKRLAAIRQGKLVDELYMARVNEPSSQ